MVDIFVNIKKKKTTLNKYLKLIWLKNVITSIKKKNSK